MNNVYYTVMLWGRTKPHTRPLGHYIFRTFRIGRSALDVLEVVNDPKYLYHSDITFGLRSEVLKKYHFRAMGYLDDHKTTYEVALREWKAAPPFNRTLHPQYTPLHWLVVAVNDTNLYMTTNPYDFEFPFNASAYFHPFYPHGWHEAHLYQEKAKFKDIFGMYCTHVKLYAAAWDVDPSVKEPKIYYVFEDSATRNRSTFLFNPEIVSSLTLICESLTLIFR